MDKQELKEVLTQVLLSEEFVNKLATAIMNAPMEYTIGEIKDKTQVVEYEPAYIVSTENVFADKC